MKKLVLAMVLFATPVMAQTIPSGYPYYVLKADSVYKGAATDGTDLGANARWDKIEICAVKGQTSLECALLGLDGGIGGQSSDSIKQGTPFGVAFDHNGVDTLGYRLLLNTQEVQTLPVSALANGTATFQMAQGLPKGTYTIIVEAYGDGGATASAPFSLSVTAGNPAAPGQIRIIK